MKSDRIEGVYDGCKDLNCKAKIESLKSYIDLLKYQIAEEEKHSDWLDKMLTQERINSNNYFDALCKTMHQIHGKPARLFLFGFLGIASYTLAMWLTS